MKKLLPLIIICLFLFCSCSKTEEINGFNMDSPYSVKLNGMTSLQKKEIRTALSNSDKLFNAYKESELYTLNEEKHISKTEENKDLFAVIEQSLPYCGEFFDISVRPYTSLWDFSSDSPVPPTEAELTEAKKSVGYENIVINDNEITLLNNAQIELGAVAKGYMCDKVYEIADNCTGIIDIGGTIKSTLNRKASVGVKNPNGGFFCTVFIEKGESVSTSGSYERNFTYNGETYCHILNPKTGKSVRNGLLSVTVISDSALKSDILSTSYFVSGIENAKIPNDITVIFVTENGGITVLGKEREIRYE